MTQTQISLGREDGGDLQRLLFLTNSARLCADVGADADRVLSALFAMGCTIIDESGDVALRDKAMAVMGGFEGAVILGGYDVVPPWAVDALTSAHRQSGLVVSDPDDFLVWSDERYVESALPNHAAIPISRVPTNGSGAILIAALSRTVGNSSGGGGCVHLNERPFAPAAFQAGTRKVRFETSSPFCCKLDTGHQLGPILSNDWVFAVLHGDHQLLSTYWGDDPSGNAIPVAIDVSDAAQASARLILCTACWGALLCKERPLDQANNFTPISKDDSIALTVDFRREVTLDFH